MVWFLLKRNLEVADRLDRVSQFHVYGAGQMMVVGVTDARLVDLLQSLNGALEPLRAVQK